MELAEKVVFLFGLISGCLTCFFEIRPMAKVHEISVEAARKLYYSAVQRLLTVIMEMDAVDNMTEKERKRANVAKQKRYLEKKRDAVNAKRRERYAAGKDKR